LNYRNFVSLWPVDLLFVCIGNNQRHQKYFDIGVPNLNGNVKVGVVKGYFGHITSWIDAAWFRWHHIFDWWHDLGGIISWIGGIV